MNTEYNLFDVVILITLFVLLDDSVVGEKSTSKVVLKINATHVYNSKKVKCRAENVVTKAEESRTITIFCKYLY